MRVTYKCNSCGVETTHSVSGKPPMSLDCPSCGHKSVRAFKNMSSDKIADNVSYATSTILYAGMPSGRDKAVI